MSKLQNSRPLVSYLPGLCIASVLLYFALSGLSWLSGGITFRDAPRLVIPLVALGGAIALTLRAARQLRRPASPEHSARGLAFTLPLCLLIVAIGTSLTALFLAGPHWFALFR